jgi:hypothetical protein
MKDIAFNNSMSNAILYTMFSITQAGTQIWAHSIGNRLFYRRALNPM